MANVRTAEHEGGATGATDAHRRYHHGDLRAALIAGATHAIREGGPDALSLRAVAAVAGVTHRASAAHFRNKEALVAAVAAGGYDRLRDRIADALAARETDGHTDGYTNGRAEGQRVAATLERIALAYGAFARDETELFVLMNGRRLNAKGEHTDLEASLRAAFAVLTDALRDAGMPDGEAETAGLHAWASLQGVLVQWALGRIRVRDDRFEGFMRDTARRVAFGLTVGADGAANEATVAGGANPSEP